MVCENIPAAAGTVTQVRESIQHFIKLAKSTGIAFMVVGHITKEGMIAGPKVLEHMVDAVLYFEGERSYPYRLLRTVKNRFGATDEVGVFDMTDKGLREVSNPSALFLSHRQKPVPGACIFAGLEGTRPLLVEIQALSTPSFLASPRRSVVGWDNHRLSMILAVLEARCQMSFSQKDVFLTVLGGLKISEPAADLCVAMALISCLKNKPLPEGLIAFGEIGLTGEISPVSYSDQRLKESLKLGFLKACMPLNSKVFSQESLSQMHIDRLTHVKELDLWFKSCLS
jgi:DNA repair protein RadA/Sms